MGSTVSKLVKASTLGLVDLDPKKPPRPKKPPPMPTRDDDAIRQMQRKSLALQRARGGRASTLLTERETLG